MLMGLYFLLLYWLSLMHNNCVNLSMVILYRKGRHGVFMVTWKFKLSQQKQWKHEHMIMWKRKLQDLISVGLSSVFNITKNHYLVKFNFQHTNNLCYFCLFNIYILIDNVVYFIGSYSCSGQFISVIDGPTSTRWSRSNNLSNKF